MQVSLRRCKCRIPGGDSIGPPRKCGAMGCWIWLKRVNDVSPWVGDVSGLNPKMINAGYDSGCRRYRSGGACAVFPVAIRSALPANAGRWVVGFGSSTLTVRPLAWEIGGRARRDVCAVLDQRRDAAWCVCDTCARELQKARAVLLRSAVWECPPYGGRSCVALRMISATVPSCPLGCGDHCGRHMHIMCVACHCAVPSCPSGCGDHHDWHVAPCACWPRVVCVVA